MSDETRAPEGSPSRDDFVTRILDQLVDLLQTARDWIQQEAEATVRTKIVPPLQALGITVAAATAAATLLVLGLIFIAVAGIVWLSQLLGVPLAFLSIGLVYVSGAAGFTYLKVRKMQR
ncbi:MAG: hypothetical protein Q7W30_07345 [Coriobacteriia bacterium]|nr:hypothetical protein [Coriobacteriia bacterium]